jgi:2-amino-4-hydroxy-6-hydroxymethyldihydropteridine diphosphokinase
VGEVPDQRDFYNAVVEVETELDPQDLLDACRRVEQALGRVGGGPRHGPRPIDVDVLILGDRVVRSDRLALPHPEITRRRFVLAPLLELDAGLVLPTGASLAEAAAGLGAGQRVERLGALE